MVRKNIDIIVTMVDKITGKAKQIETSTKKLRNGVQKTTKTYDQFNRLIAEKTKFTKEKENLTRFAKKHRGLAGALGMNTQEFKKFDDDTGKLNKRMMKQMGVMGRVGMRVRMLTHGFRGFRMEMLGVMFFGMGIQKFFTGLLKPALQLSGFMDLLSMTLAMVFLPVALALLDLLLPLFMWLMNLSDATKLLIGKIVLIGAVIGGILFIVGMFALGIGSLILALSGVFSLISNLLGPLGSFGAGLFLIGGASKVIGPIWNSIKSIISKVWEKFLEIPAIQDLLSALGVDIEDLKEPWKTIKTKAKEFFDWLKEKTGIDVTEDITDLKETFEGFAQSMGEIATALTGTIVPALEDFYKIMKLIVGLPSWVREWMFAKIEPIRGPEFPLAGAPEEPFTTPGGAIHGAGYIPPAPEIRITIENNTDAIVRTSPEVI